MSPLLRDRMATEGRWLFFHRSLVPMLLLPAIIPAVVRFQPPFGERAWNVAWVAVCFAVSFAGLVVRGLVAGYVPSGTSGRSVRNLRAETLNTSGMYSVCRNPLYLGNSLVGLGVLLCLHDPYVLVLYTLLFWLHYERIVLAEEVFLSGKFGEAYAAWAESTPVFVPRLALWKPAGRPFSWARLLRREAGTFAGILLAMTAFEVVTGYFVHGEPRFEVGWRIVVGIAMAAHIPVRVLKRIDRLRGGDDSRVEQSG
ncbi:MAG: lipid A phosphate methyltransferase [Planctomycetes bacterium]|nr:lipid A phosphate methyltransferase [Planctomycetota bacterium]